jgi:hypothetical protein
VPDPAASLAAQIGDLAMAMAYARWLDPAKKVGYSELAREALDELRHATPALG